MNIEFNESENVAAAPNEIDLSQLNILNQLKTQLEIATQTFVNER